VSFLFLPEGEDPDTLVRKEGREAFVTRLRKSVPLPDYLFDTLSRQVDLGRLDGRARLVELARPHMSKMPQGILHQMMLDRLAELSKTDPGKLPGMAVNSATMAQSRPLLRRAGGPQEPPSIVRRAIALLIQHPGLAQKLKNEVELADLDLPGMALFIELSELLKISPDMITASIIENFRDSEHQHHLAKLAAWDYPSQVEDVESEFIGVIQRLAEASIKQKLERLLQKNEVGALNQVERDELARLLSLKRDNSRLSPYRH
jgi:DNA primase